MNKSNYLKIDTELLKLESKFDLLNWMISGVYVWQVARIAIYMKLKYGINLKESELEQLNFSIKIKLFFERIIFNIIRYNPFIGIKNVDIMVFESSRKYLVNNIYIDKYTKFLCDDFDKKGISYQRYQSSYLFDRLSKSRKGIKHLDFIFLLARLKTKLHSGNNVVDSIHLEKIGLIESEILLLFGEKINLKEIFNNTIIEFKALHSLYTILFKRIKPKEIYLTNYCNKSALISAAKETGVIVNELQHGLMPDNSFIWHFPNTIPNSLSYFPNRYFLWSNIHMCSSKLPISDDNIVFIEYKYLTSIKNKYKNIKKEKNKILIVSQPQYTKKLIQFVLHNLPNMNDYQFIFKIHPTEELNFENDNQIKQIEKYNNFKFANNQSSMENLFSTSEYVIGIYSAALFEASYMGCKIILLNLPGVEMASALIEYDDAQLIETNVDLSSIL